MQARDIEDLRGVLEMMVAALIVLSIVAAGGAGYGVRTRRFRSRRVRARLHMATAHSAESGSSHAPSRNWLEQPACWQPEPDLADQKRSTIAREG